MSCIRLSLLPRLSPIFVRVVQGTWQFMSATMLMSSKTPVRTLADDLESFLHVSSWVALRFSPHGLTSTALTDLLV
jgi:hypothetical protein